jgi:hypothetical protein
MGTDLVKMVAQRLKNLPIASPSALFTPGSATCPYVY